MENFDTALNRAHTQVRHMPAFRLGMWSFNDWLYNNYKMRACLYDDGDDCNPEALQWEIIALEDEGLATMFKLKFG